MDWTAAINPAMYIGSGGLAYMGQKETNAANREIADSATKNNMEEAQRNRDFQERMSNTAVQRYTKDLEASGWNPVLATQNAASTPAGGQGTAATAEMGNAMGAAVSTAMEAADLKQNLSNKKAQEALTDAQKALTDVEKDVASATAQGRRNENLITAAQIPKAQAESQMYQKYGKELVLAEKFTGLLGSMMGIATSGKGLMLRGQKDVTVPKYDLPEGMK